MLVWLLSLLSGHLRDAPERQGGELLLRAGGLHGACCMVVVSVVVSVSITSITSIILSVSFSLLLL